MEGCFHAVHHLHQWAVGKPAAVAVVAQQLAAGAPLTIDWVNLIRSGAAARQLHDAQASPDWLHLYRDPARMRRVVQATFWPDGKPEVMPQFGRFLEMRQARPASDKLAMLDNAPPEAMAMVRTFVHEALQRMYVEHLADLATVLAATDPLPNVDMDQAMALPEVQFCLLAVVPAMLEYGESPTQLYAKARRGVRLGRVSQSPDEPGVPCGAQPTLGRSGPRPSAIGGHVKQAR